jgi:hypothetical protein
MRPAKPADWRRYTLQAPGSLQRAIHGGAERYDRNRHLPRIIPAGSEVFGENTEAGRRNILARIARALRAERNRGRAGHWTYDLNRHIALAQAYAAERRRLGEAPPKIQSGNVERTTSDGAAGRVPSSSPGPNAPRRS